MNRILPHLILYSDLGRDSILVRLAEIIRACREGGAKEPLLQRANAEVKRILDLSTACDSPAALTRTSGSATSPGSS